MTHSIADYFTSVLEAWSPTPTTRAVRISKPPDFSFVTGQACRFFVDPVGQLARPMSIASSSEREHLDFVARHSDSDFKRAFFALSAHDRVHIWGPRGQFLLDWNRSAVMLAGGIGITPFRSMLETMSDKGAGPPTLLVYANRSPSEVAFFTELGEIASRLSNLEIRHTVSRVEPADQWAHQIGRIDSEYLRTQVVGKYPNVVYYLAGPREFVSTITEALLAAGADRNDIRSEVFQGYLSA